MEKEEGKEAEEICSEMEKISVKGKGMILMGGGGVLAVRIE